MRVLVCGDRNGGVGPEIIAKVLSNYEPSLTTVVHGGCQGVDTLAGEVAKKMGFTVEVHPAQWNIYGKSAGPIRNREMIDSGVDHIIASILTSNKAREQKTRRNML